MKLTLESVPVGAIQFGDKTRVDKGTLIVNSEELQAHIIDPEFFQEVKIAIALPGEATRIINVVDVVEPRCKIEGGDDFPGTLCNPMTVGTGVTRALKGVAVVMCDRHKHWIHSKNLIDMSGPGAALTRYANMPLLVVDPIPKPDVDEWALALAIRVAGFKASVYLAKAAEASQVEKTVTYDNSKQDPNLPTFAYYYNIYSTQHDAKGIASPIFYGMPIPHNLPMLISPTEILDGGVTSGYYNRMMETYSQQNHPIVTELYERHGKDLNFGGVVLGVCSLEAKRRQFNAVVVGNLIKEMIKADAAIFTKALGGAPNLDIGMAATECENRGIKTCLMIQVLNTFASLETEVLFGDTRLNAIVNTGVIFERFNLPAFDHIHGGTVETPVFNDSKKQVAGEPIELEMRFLCGALSQIGNSTMTCVDY